MRNMMKKTKIKDGGGSGGGAGGRRKSSVSFRRRTSVEEKNLSSFFRAHFKNSASLPPTFPCLQLLTGPAYEKQGFSFVAPPAAPRSRASSTVQQ
jgi:hypothetical protein